MIKIVILTNKFENDSPFFVADGGGYTTEPIEAALFSPEEALDFYEKSPTEDHLFLELFETVDYLKSRLTSPRTGYQITQLVELGEKTGLEQIPDEEYIPALEAFKNSLKTLKGAKS